MDTYFEELAVRAATIDELLGPDFETLSPDKSTAEVSASRLASWCRACANGDWEQFAARLARQGSTFEQVLSRFSGARRNPSTPFSQWLVDAVWIEEAMRVPTTTAAPKEATPFIDLVIPVVEHADKLVWTSSARLEFKFSASARISLRDMLLDELTELCAPAFYECFSAARSEAAKTLDRGDANSRTIYSNFVFKMRASGLRELFKDKPVLLRLIAVLTRQWIDSSREFLQRLTADANQIAEQLLAKPSLPTLSTIEGSRSDRHNGGRTVLILTFEDGSRIVYKPKDLRIDLAWKRAIDDLNANNPPIDLKLPSILAKDGYGWSEFVQHVGCNSNTQFGTYFRRAGAWLALLHRFVAADMHQENIIASGEYPVPIDLETVFHTRGDEWKDLEDGARGAARRLLADSVMMVGLLPAYGRSPFNRVFAVGGLTSGWTQTTKIEWIDVNSDAMRPKRAEHNPGTNPNLPHVERKYAKFKDHVDELVSGFREYALFLADQPTSGISLLDYFVGLPVRKVLRPTRFYYMLQQRLRNHKTMRDGVTWSSQVDFLQRLPSPEWAMLEVQSKEREALLSLNIPHFTSLTDQAEIRDDSGLRVRTGGPSGIQRARSRLEHYDAREIEWQVEVIIENTRPAPWSKQPLNTAAATTSFPARAQIEKAALEEATRIANELSRCAIRKDREAAWIGREWLEDAEAFQLACLGPDLYNGATGIALFLAAYSKVSGSSSAESLSRAAVKRLQNDLKGSEGARIARTLGIGGAAGFGSVVYALAVMADLLGDASLRKDAHRAALLITPELINADNRLDVIGGSAGAILCLLRLYRDSGSNEVLDRAIACGDHLLSQPRTGPNGKRSWACLGAGPRPLNGMSHGAAGFAYALSALAAVTSETRFLTAAQEAIAFENNTYSTDQKNWPDFRRKNSPGWAIRWCHGAPGIGLARLAMTKLKTQSNRAELLHDVSNAIECTESSWAGDVDTLCCGSFGNIELLREAGKTLDQRQLKDIATDALCNILSSAQAHGDYRWSGGARKFNLGLFRGLAGVGYSCLREIDLDLPNVLIWE